MNVPKEIEAINYTFGLAPKSLERLKKLFAKNENIKCVMLYGSRAKGDFKNHSDIDLAVMSTLSFDELLRLETEIDDLLLPQEVDLIRFDSIENTALKEHIERWGKVFYKRQN
jgi:predicted nucleotidyltransferase